MHEKYCHSSQNWLLSGQNPKNKFRVFFCRLISLDAEYLLLTLLLFASSRPACLELLSSPNEIKQKSFERSLEREQTTPFFSLTDHVDVDVSDFWCAQVRIGGETRKDITVIPPMKGGHFEIIPHDSVLSVDLLNDIVESDLTSFPCQPRQRLPALGFADQGHCRAFLHRFTDLVQNFPMLGSDQRWGWRN